MGANRPFEPVRSGSQAEPAQADWSRLAAEARIYASAGAWDAARDHLWPHFAPIWLSADVPAGAIEPLALLLIALIHLDESARAGEITRWLQAAHTSNPNRAPESLVLAQLLLARSRLEAGDSTSARALLDEAERSGRSGVTPWTLAHARIVRGRMETRESRLSEAETVALQAVAFAEKSGSDVLIGDALNLLATVLRFQRRTDAAQRLYARSAACYWRAGDATGRVSSLINRGALLNGLGLLQESCAIFKEAHGAATAAGRETGKLRARLGMGWVSARGGDSATARRVLLSAWRQARRLGLRRDEALALEYLAESYLLAGDTRKTRLAIHACKRLVQKLGPQSDIVIELGIREALLSVADGSLSAAMTQARRSIKQAQDAALPWEEAQAFRTLGTALARAHRNREARESFLAAREILQRIGEQLELRVVESWIDALDSKNGPRTTAEKAASVLDDKAIEVEGVQYWRDHPLLGPKIIQTSRQRRAVSVAREAGAPHPIVFRIDELSVAVEKCPPRIPTGRQPNEIWSELGLVTREPELIKTLLLAETFAPGPFPVLILGETGTGKELLAQGLHALSKFPGRFVPVNCAAAHREVFLAELFGARKGAFTGAFEERSGLIQEAQGGTIFFDEIADLDPAAQGFLLRFLDSGEVRPLGAAKSTRVQTRIVTATSRNLQSLVATGVFRRDLYARLVAAVLQLPALRDRSADLEALIRSLWSRMHGDPAVFDRVFTPLVWSALRERPWPGNVRDLVHVVGRALLFVASLGPEAASEHILENAGQQWHSSLATPDAVPESRFAENLAPFSRSQRRSERTAADFAWALRAANGDIPETARLLGISRSHAYRLYKALRRN